MEAIKVEDYERAYFSTYFSKVHIELTNTIVLAVNVDDIVHF